MLAVMNLIALRVLLPLKLKLDRSRERENGSGEQK
jgi:hypothetical protein